MTRIACIGEAMIELTVSEPPALGIAGDTFNTAVYLKRLAPALKVSFVTRLGVDSFSDRIRAAVAQHGLGTDHLELSQDRIPGLYAITTQDGERSFTYWRDQSAARQLFQGPEGPDFTLLDGFDVLYLSAITLAILPAGIRAALHGWIKASGKTLVFDSNYRPRLWASRAQAQEVIAAWWQSADIVLPSIDDEMALFEQSAEEVTARFRQLGTPGALKRGAEGPLPLGPEAVPPQTYPAAPAVVDTTAAGDSFNAGYLASHLTGGTQAEALMAGHRCAAQVVGHRGAIIPEALTAALTEALR